MNLACCNVTAVSPVRKVTCLSKSGTVPSIAVQHQYVQYGSEILFPEQVHQCICCPIDVPPLPHRHPLFVFSSHWGSAAYAVSLTPLAALPSPVVAADYC